MQITTHVFVQSIVRTNNRTVVTATQGGSEGLPKVVFELIGDPTTCYIGKRFIMTLEDTAND